MKWQISLSKNLPTKRNGNIQKILWQVFCYFGKSEFPKPCQIGKKLAKKVSLEMILRGKMDNLNSSFLLGRLTLSLTRMHLASTYFRIYQDGTFLHSTTMSICLCVLHADLAAWVLYGVCALTAICSTHGMIHDTIINTLMPAPVAATPYAHISIFLDFKEHVL